MRNVSMLMAHRTVVPCLVHEHGDFPSLLGSD